MIGAVGLTARFGRVELAGTTLELAEGRHALVGGADDGPSVLLACIGGELRPKRGKLSVLGGAPHDPRVRARVGYVPLDVLLPDVLRVDEVLDMAWRTRGDRPADGDAARALDALGASGLLRRRVRSLDAGEVRAVALAEALWAPGVSVVLIEEPFVAMAPPAVGALPSALADAERAKKCVVVATASWHDATRLANSFAVFERGRLAKVGRDVPQKTGPSRLRIGTPHARALAAALAQQKLVARLQLDEGSVIVEGEDAAALAATLNEAIASAGIDVTRIEAERT